ncbi:MAG: ABC transporter permease [Beijerinckiaceae bacterium]
MSFARILGLATAVALALLTVYPLIWLILKSLQGAEFPRWANYVDVFTTPRYLDAIWRSVQVATIVACLSVVIGVGMAWAVARTDMPGKGFVRACVIGSFITPPFLGALAWILLAAPQAGALNKALALLLGIQPTVLNIYSLTGLCFVMAIYAYPFAYLFTAASLELMSSEVEDAALILGASMWRTIRSITIPIVLPAILGSFVLVFVESLALLGSPLLLTTPARIQLITTQVYEFFQYPARIEYAAAYSLPLLLITVALVLLQNRLLRKRSFATLTGKGGARLLVELGGWRYVVLGACLLVCALSLFLPYMALLLASVSKAWGQGLSLANITLEHFRWILVSHGTTQQAILNTLWFSAAAACLAMILAFAAAYIQARRLVPGAQMFGYAAMFPAVIPGIVLAIGFLAAFASPPFFLYGTPTILILAFTTRFLPIAYVSSSSSLRNVHPEFEDAARILGASAGRAVRSVTVPLVGKGLLSGWLLVMLSGIRELSAAIFLFAASTKVMAILLIDLSEEGQFERLAALSVLMLIMTLALVIVGYGTVGRQFVWQRQ